MLRMNKLLSTLAILGAVVFLGGRSAADGPADERKKLEGTWLVDKATSDGKPVEDVKGGRVVFAGEKLTLKAADGKEEKFTYKVDPAQKPKTMDAAPEKKEKDAPPPGKAIYELDGDTLKVCFGPPDSFMVSKVKGAHPGTLKILLLFSRLLGDRH